MRDNSAMASVGQEPQARDSWGTLARDARNHALRTFLPVLVPVVAMWAFYLVYVFTGNWITIALGLEARSISGLAGILFMPLLHGGLGHLLGNTFSWLVLGGMVTLLNRRFMLIMGLIWLISGVLLWIGGTPWICHAPEGFDCVRRHIGASAVIYGFAAFLVVYGILTRRLLAILFAVVTMIVYGLSMLVGMVPLNSGGVSWTGHIAGALAGVVVAFILTRGVRAERRARRGIPSSSGETATAARRLGRRS